MSAPHLFTRAELDGMVRAELDLIALARGVEADGTGEGGNVLNNDLVDAILTAQDQTGINPAIVATPPTASSKTYVVLAGTVYDTPAGGTFTMTLPPAQEAMLIEGGAINVADENTAVAEPDPFAITPGEHRIIQAGIDNPDPDGVRLMNDDELNEYVASTSVDGILDDLGDTPDASPDKLLAKRLLASEQARTAPRATLVRALQTIITEKE